MPPSAAVSTPTGSSCGAISQRDSTSAANSNTAPGVVDSNREPIYDTSEIYSGVYARVSLSFYAFNSNGNRGIACALQNIQKVRDGEALGGKSKAEDDFNDNFTSDDGGFLN